MRKQIITVLLLCMFCTWTSNSFAAIVVPAASSSKEPDPATVKAAIEAFKGLSNKEKRVKLKLAKKEIKTYKKRSKHGDEVDTNTLLLVIIAIILPPLAVYLHEDEINNKFWITLLLFLLGIAGAFFLSWVALLAAIVYALLVVLGNA
jgi:uncharacterized membrane protein YqaE (UPF0057 family)